MTHSFFEVIKFLVAAAAISSIAYYAFCLWSAYDFVRRDPRFPAATTPPVSILKPLKGTDVEMYNNFRSHCLQDYPAYELIFGVSEPEDPAIHLVEQLKSEFPQRDIRLVYCEQNIGANTKVSNLAQMLPHARNEYIIVNDSDIRVPTNYLQSVTAPLSDRNIGLVTCLYRGVATSTVGSLLESLGISTDFIPGVLVARKLQGIRFGLGSTLAFRRADLRAAGGFEAVADYLADDYQIGERIAALGLNVVLPDSVVDSYLPRYTLRSFLEHQLRWARTLRDSRFWGYVGLGVTFGLPWAILTVILAAGTGWAWGILAAVAGMRVAVAVAAGSFVLRDTQVLPRLWWLPIRDFLAFSVWLHSFTGSTVAWRGTSYILKGGKLARMTL
jgi:ceramide glucosyltransferase